MAEPSPPPAGGVLPAWRRATQGEHRWQASSAIVAAAALQLLLPTDLTLGGRYLLPALEVVLLAGILVANPQRIDRHTAPLRTASLTLIALITAANVWSVGRLVHVIVTGSGLAVPTHLLGSGASIWVTNVIAFALWYWDLDRGGPARRAAGEREHADLLFPQMATPELAHPDWEPTFVDYLFVSFTNATAFSPTDVLPLARWAKLTMMVQAAVSLVTVGLVVARAVNVLR